MKRSQNQVDKQVIEQLYKRGMPKDAHRQLEFFFYAEKYDDAANLAIALQKKAYSLRPVEQNNGRWSVNGWTQKMPMDLESLNAWSSAMEELAETHNSEFDGWGTFA